jgi:hypothetical protein
VITNSADGLQEKASVAWQQIVKILLKGYGRPGMVEYASIFELPLDLGNTQLTLPPNNRYTVLTPELQSHFTANLGFTDQHINFHIDTGLAALSALTGECQKLWLIAPPYEENMALLTKGNHTIAYLASRLNSLVIFRQTAADVIYLPPGAIHATFTEKAGMLYGNNFRLRQNVFGATMGLAQMMIEEKGQDADYTEENSMIQGWIGHMRTVKESGTKEEEQEAIAAFRLRCIKELRRTGKFREFGVDVDQLAEECYPKARLRNEAVDTEDEEGGKPLDNEGDSDVPDDYSDTSVDDLDDLLPETD